MGSDARSSFLSIVNPIMPPDREPEGGCCAYLSPVWRPGAEHRQEVDVAIEDRRSPLGIHGA